MPAGCLRSPWLNPRFAVARRIDCDCILLLEIPIPNVQDINVAGRISCNSAEWSWENSNKSILWTSQRLDQIRKAPFTFFHVLSRASSQQLDSFRCAQIAWAGTRCRKPAFRRALCVEVRSTLAQGSIALLLRRYDCRFGSSMNPWALPRVLLCISRYGPVIPSPPKLASGAID